SVVARSSGQDRAESDPGIPPTSPGDSTTSDTPSPETSTSTPVDPVATGPMRVAVLGDSVAHTLIGGRLDGFLAGLPWAPDQSSFDPEQVEVVPVTRPVCSFLEGDVVVSDGGALAPVDLSEFCAGWSDDLRAAVAGPESVDATLVLLTNDLEDRSIDGELVEVGSPRWEKALTDWLELLRAISVDDDSLLVLAATAPRLEPTWDDAVGVREAMMADVFTRYAATHDGVETVDLGPFVAGRDIRYDGLHYTPEGASEVAAWLTPQLHSLRDGQSASSSGTGTTG
ncbi:hypothetical protein, partial [Ilumatobacter sp.]|uniref:hypothetical protein n=1 Tax=Ilumatobacter sp. TaxID=1967498 RepID=UPI003C674E37